MQQVPVGDRIEVLLVDRAHAVDHLPPRPDGIGVDPAPAEDRAADGRRVAAGLLGGGPDLREARGQLLGGVHVRHPHVAEAAGAADRGRAPAAQPDRRPTRRNRPGGEGKPGHAGEPAVEVHRAAGPERLQQFERLVGAPTPLPDLDARRFELRRVSPPTPTPMSNRPPDTWSSVVASFAARAAG